MHKSKTPRWLGFILPMDALTWKQWHTKVKGMKCVKSQFIIKGLTNKKR